MLDVDNSGPHGGLGAGRPAGSDPHDSLFRSGPVGQGALARRAWRSAYVRRLVVADALSAAVAGAVAFSLRFPLHDAAPTNVSVVTGLLLPLAWVCCMLIARSYEERFLWIGPDEFRRVFVAGFAMLGTVGTVSYAFKLEIARGFVLVALPLATLLTLLERYAQRKRLHHQRAQGRKQSTTLLVGHRSAVSTLHEQLAREAYHGYHVVGCCLSDDDQESATFDGLPVLGNLDEVVEAVNRYDVDTVAVLPTRELDGPALRRLGWQLETTHAELLLAPAITEVAGPRIHIRPVSGLPLLHMERPELRGVRRLAKEVSDVVGAVLLLVLLAPLFLAVVVAVKATTPGPAFFTQERIGRGGRPFQMLKIRSMVNGAESMQEALATESDGNGVLFKMKNDRRVTPVGRYLRRYSLDELPQLLNVIRGEMSLVGPRPPLASEVNHYGVDMRRRFLVKPGLTGLWQVSGRSDLSWNDSVRIDVQYVENWSLTLDLMILWKTVGAVVRGPGAY